MRATSHRMDPRGSIPGIADEENFARLTVGVNNDVASLAPLDRVPEIVDRSGDRPTFSDQNPLHEVAARLPSPEQSHQRVICKRACRTEVRLRGDAANVEDGAGSRLFSSLDGFI